MPFINPAWPVAHSWLLMPGFDAVIPEAPPRAPGEPVKEPRHAIIGGAVAGRGGGPARRRPADGELSSDARVRTVRRRDCAVSLIPISGLFSM